MIELPNVPGTTHYANSRTGDDGNDGLTAGTAFRTIGRSLAALDTPGGDELVLEGVFQEPLNISWINYPNPDPGRPTVIRAAVDEWGKKKEAMIDGGVPPSAVNFPFDKQGLPPGFGPGQGNYLDRGIIVAQANHVWVDGIKVQGIAGLGVLTWRASHVTLHDLNVQWTTESALMLSHGQSTDSVAQNLTVVNCRINQSNLGVWADKSAPNPGYNMKSETVSVVKWDGFRICCNHVSNSLMEGIDFKEGSRNGEVCHNIIENTRKVAIYVNEGRESSIHHNIVRRVGWYDPEDGTGLKRASTYLGQKIGATNVSEAGSSGIIISNGDLLDGPLESGKVFGIDVHHNVICQVLWSGISIYNEWYAEGRDGWLIDDIHIFNNTICRAALGEPRNSSGLSIEVSSTNIEIANNLVVDSQQLGGNIWNSHKGNFYEQNVWTHALYYGNAQTGENGTNSILADPRLVEAPAGLEDNGILGLRHGSPAQDSGIDMAEPFFGAAPDLGAFEQGEPAWEAGVAPRD